MCSYQDAPSTSQAVIPQVENPGPASLLQNCANVENEKEVGMWTNAKIKMVHDNVVPHQPLPFVRKCFKIFLFSFSSG